MFKYVIHLLLLWHTCGDPAHQIVPPIWNSKGYLMYCPCSGKFGQQVEFLLGSISVARHLERTLIIPPIIERHGRNRSFRKFSDIFSWDDLRDEDVIEMADFLEHFASTWDASKRVAFCHKANLSEDGRICNMQSDECSKEFWNFQNISFDSSQTTLHLANLTINPHQSALAWKAAFPSNNFPVISLAEAPAVYPVAPSDIPNQEYLKFAPKILSKAQTYMKALKKVSKLGTSLSIHLRQGSDWNNICKEGIGRSSVRSSPQCLPSPTGLKEVTQNICLPSLKLVAKTAVEMVKRYGVSAIFIASDANPSKPIYSIERALQRHNLEAETTVRTLPVSDLYEDIAIMGMTDYFLGNCLSSITAFVKRQRDLRGLPSSFFGIEEELHHKLSGDGSQQLPETRAKDEL